MLAHTSTLSEALRVAGGKITAMRAIALAIITLMLGGCMQETLAPTTQAGWSARDRQLMSNLPYAQATISDEYKRHIVQYARREAPGHHRRRYQQQISLLRPA